MSRLGRLHDAGPCTQLARQTGRYLAPIGLPAASVVIFSCLLCVGCGEAARFADAYVVDSRYESRADAEVAGAIAENSAYGDRWLPAMLPASASDIRERHCLDTNEVWISFAFDSQDAEAIADHCERVTRSEVHPPMNPNRFRGEPFIDWWPDDLFENYLKYDFYNCGHQCYLAIDKEALRGFYWSGP